MTPTATAAPTPPAWATSGDDYYNGGAGWAPIGGHGETTHQAFTATFDGNGNDIENLYLNLETDAANAGTYVGLFADLTGTVRNVGLTDPYVKNARRGAVTAFPFVRTGALAGRNNAGGVVRGSSVTGGAVTGDQSAVTGAAVNLVGCLLGYNAGTVRDSSAGCAATATGVGGLSATRPAAWSGRECRHHGELRAAPAWCKTATPPAM